MRKALALALIKLAHRVYPPKITPYSAEGAMDQVGRRIERAALSVIGQIGELTSYEAQQLAARRESRGWN